MRDLDWIKASNAEAIEPVQNQNADKIEELRLELAFVKAQKSEYLGMIRELEALMDFVEYNRDGKLALTMHMNQHHEAISSHLDEQYDSIQAIEKQIESLENK